MTTRPSAPVDDIDNIRRFVAAIGLDRVSSQSSGSTLQAEQRCAEMTSNESTMQGEQHSSTETTALASPNNDNSNDQSSSTLASTPLTRSRANSGSPSHYLTASPQIGGLLAPQNTPQTIPASPDIHAPRTNKTPKTGPTSPDLNAPCTNNEDVSEALYDYFTNLQGMKPLSESIWAPKNIQATRQRSLLNGPRMPPRTPAPNMTAVSVVQPNPDINDTFTRLSFKAADHDYKADAFGDRVESSSSSSKIASQGNRFDILATSESSDKNDVSSPSASAGKENRSLSTPVAEENVTSSITKPSYLPPHLRVKEIASNLSRTDSVTEKKPKETENSDSAPAVKQAQGHKPILPSSFLGRWGATKKHVEDTLTADTAFGTGKDVSETAVGNEKRRSDATVGMDKGPTTVTSVNKSPVPTEVIEDASLSDLKLTGKSSNTSREHAPARPIKAAVEQGKAPESLEKKLFFSAWPQSEARERGPAKIRKVLIKPLPTDATATFVASLVYGGPIEQIHLREGSAAVRFLHAADCIKFYDETSNGLVYGKDIQGREKVVFVELAKDVDVVGGLLSQWIDAGVTRCVRAVGVEEDVSKEYLVKVASRKNRKVEAVVEGKTSGGSRFVIFRFVDMADAVTFKGALGRDEEWEACNLSYVPDPCETAIGVHFDT